MRRPWIFLVALAFAGAALAQNYKWIDKDGKTRYGDTPPAGVKATAMRGPASAAPAAAPASASKDAKRGPMTPAEQEQDYRKRQQEAKKAGEKSEQEKQEQASKSESCDRAKEYLRTLSSGERIARTNASGERYFLDDAQRAQESVKAQQAAQQACAG